MTPLLIILSHPVTDMMDDRWKLNVLYEVKCHSVMTSYLNRSPLHALELTRRIVRKPNTLRRCRSGAETVSITHCTLSALY